MDKKFSRKNFEDAGLDGLKVLLPELEQAIQKEIDVVSNLDLPPLGKGEKFLHKCEQIRNELTELGHELYQLVYPDIKDIYEKNSDVWASDYPDCDPNGLAITFSPLHTRVIWEIGKNTPDFLGDKS